MSINNNIAIDQVVRVVESFNIHTTYIYLQECLEDNLLSILRSTIFSNINQTSFAKAGISSSEELRVNKVKV